METPKVRQALQTLAPFIDAFQALYQDVEELSKVEAQAQAAKATLGQHQARAEEAKKSSADAKADRDRALSDLAEAKAQARTVREQAQKDSGDMMVAASREAHAAADQIKGQREVELRDLADQIAAGNKEVADINKAIASARAEHDSVLASMNSLKSRLG